MRWGFCMNSYSQTPPLNITVTGTKADWLHTNYPAIFHNKIFMTRHQNVLLCLSLPSIFFFCLCNFLQDKHIYNLKCVKSPFLKNDLLSELLLTCFICSNFYRDKLKKADEILCVKDSRREPYGQSKSILYINIFPYFHEVLMICICSWEWDIFFQTEMMWLNMQS